MAYAVDFEVPPWSYGRALSELAAVLRFGIEPLVEGVVDMLAELGNPDLCYRSLQVAGTNGKTSTSRYAAAILRGQGMRVALYTSPELVSYTERMEVDGLPVSEAAFAHGVAAASVAGTRVNERRVRAGLRAYDVTEFELLTVAACVVFAEAGVDAVVFEVGLGGRWDATSAVGSIESVAVTGIGLDHCRVLGDTLEEIAAEKAAVIRAGRSCVLGAGTAAPPGVEEVFLARAAQVGVTPTLLRPLRPGDAAGVIEGGEWLRREGLPAASWRICERPRSLGGSLGLELETPRASYGPLVARKPAYQAGNIACATVLVEQFLDRELDRRALAGSVADCPTPGRFDVLRDHPLVLVDACHNPQGVRVFLSAVADVSHAGELPLLLAAVLADKDVDGIVRQLAGTFPRVVTTQTTSPRALSAIELAERFRACGTRVEGTYATVSGALDALAKDPVVACGSITLAGAVASEIGRPRSC